jgi:putative ABC transport system permease protein
MFQDLRFGARLLLKNRMVTAVAVISLALGIGANTAMFSFVDAVLLKPFAYQDPERLVMVWEKRPDSDRAMPTGAAFLAWRAHQQVFSHLAAITGAGGDLNLTGGDRAERVSGTFVSANYFETLGVKPALGRGFSAEEDQPGKDHVVVLSQGFWRRQTGADPNVIGRSLTFNSESYTVIGVLPAGGVFDREMTEVWLPLVFKPADQGRQFFTATARLKPGVTLEQANIELKGLCEALEQQGLTPGKGRSAFAQTLRDHVVGVDLRRILLLLLGAVAFILLIACANVANLLLARVALRQREVAIRAALGAGRLRLMRQFLTESMLLAMMGGCGGALLSVWMIKAFIALMPRFTLPTEAEVALDSRALLFTLGASLLTGAVFGLAPAWHASRLDLMKPLQERSAGASARWNRNKSRSLLLVGQLALTCALVIGAALLIRSLSRLLAVDPGFQPERLLTLRTKLDAKRYPLASQMLDYQTELLNRLRALPGVQAAAAANALPFGGNGLETAIRFQRRGSSEPEALGGVSIRIVSPDYFRTLGVRLLGGRELSEQDTAQTAPAVVINQTLAKSRWPGREPLGDQMFFKNDQLTQLPLTVVGVIADLKHWELSDSESKPEIYLSFAQLPEKTLDSLNGRSLQFIARTRVDPGILIGAVQSLAAGIDKDQPVYRLRTMEQAISNTVAAPRFRATLFGLFGALALILASIGVYGVMTYAVEQRTREIGIRVALGAQRGDVLKLALGQGLALTGAGLAVGLAAAFALTRYLTSFLFEVESADAVTYVAVSSLLAIVAFLACYVPARRALRVNPVEILREE